MAVSIRSTGTRQVLGIDAGCFPVPYIPSAFLTSSGLFEHGVTDGSPFGCIEGQRCAGWRDRRLVVRRGIEQGATIGQGWAGVAVLGEDGGDLLGDVADASQGDFFGHAAEGADIVFEHGFDGQGDVTTVLAPFAGVSLLSPMGSSVYSPRSATIGRLAMVPVFSHFTSCRLVKCSTVTIFCHQP